MQPYLSRRALLRAAGIAGAGATLGTLAACGTGSSSSNAASGNVVTIGFVPIGCAAPLLAADSLDLFNKHGVQISLRKFAGWADLWTAYATGELDVAHMLSPMPIALDAAATNAARPTELSFTQNTNGQALTLAAKHHGHVSSASDMRGMVLGIPFEYSVHALLLRDYLVAGGIDPVADVELRLLRPADMVAQLSVGTIDGFIGPEPFNQRALASGAGRIFTLTREMWDRHPCCSVVMSKQFRLAHPAAADAIVAALHEGASFVDDPAHVHESAPLLASEKYLNQEESLIAAGLTGSYLNWEGEQVSDPNYLSYGDPTSSTALTWMAAQLARWDLGGTRLTFDDTAIRDAAFAVLPKDAVTNDDPVTINGHVFDPTRPTAGYR
ncbi:ABC transporter substrate-binding protein [Corynebacterium lubricantis]|uniref:ABC transporter substrate-binding protein n=1 Tax=Corynebacterium lubricantis TaxID=541095 RepID=UPI00037FF724|nr:ABC transporter substrate-binding protein [Corynebacterium lubricantis]